MNEKSLVKNAAFSVFYKVLNILFPLISATYVSRILMAEGVGKVSYAQNIMSYFILIAALGIPTYGTREIAQVKDYKLLCNKTFSELFVINFISTTACLGIYLLFILINPSFREQLTLYLILALQLAFNYITIDWFYQGKEEYAYITIRNSAFKLLSILCLFVFVRKQADYIIYALISCLAIGGNNLFNIYHVRKYVQFTFRNLELQKHLKPIFILVICTIATELYSKVDITMLGSMCTDNIVGYYSNSQKMINLITTLPTAITAVFLPRLSYYYLIDREKYNALISTGLKIVLFFAIPCFAGVLIVAGNLIPVLFGESFRPAIITLRIFTPMILIKSIGDLLCYQVIISSGNERKLVFSYMAAAIINIVLNMLLIPTFAQNGSTFASVISEMVVNISLLFTSLKNIRLEISIKYLATIVISTCSMGITSYLAGSLIQSYYIGLFVQVMAGAGVYIFMSAILKNEIIKIVFKKIRHRQRPVRAGEKSLSN